MICSFTLKGKDRYKATYEYTFILDHPFWTFYFLKIYNSINVNATHFKIDCKTYSMWISRVLLILFVHFDMVCDITSWEHMGSVII